MSRYLLEIPKHQVLGLPELVPRVEAVVVRARPRKVILALLAPGERSLQMCHCLCFRPVLVVLFAVVLLKIGF